MTKWLFSCYIFFSSIVLFATSSPQTLENWVHFKEGAPHRVGLLHISKDHPIDQSTLLYVQLALRHFKEKGAACVILNLDTPGGEVFSAMKIASLFHTYSVIEDMPVIAYIDDWAISAGALLAYSCPIIVINQSSIMGAAEPVLMGNGESKPAGEKTVSALRAEFASTAQLYQRNPAIAEAMVDKDLILVKRGDEIIGLRDQSGVKPEDEVVFPEKKLLTLRASELESYHIANYFLPSNQASSVLDLPFFKSIDGIETLEFDHWKVGFFAFLTHPVIASILMFALIVGFYIEMSTPGFGWPGIIALSALGLILLTQFTLYTANYLEWILLGVGSVLILIELFFIPTFGFMGILGILLVIASLFLLFVPYIDAIDLVTFRLNPFEKEVLFYRLSWLMLSFILACAVVIILAKIFSKTLFPKYHIISKDYHETPKASFEVHSGEVGVAQTILKPSGKVEIAGLIYDAVTEGQFLEKGEKIIVLRQEGEKLVVKRIQ
ncbi:MAG: hypothetical protein K9M07_00800 [Simkaniaceae bacterium]|nr:hypothetical protein [Simkaniaceae bacterium]